MPGINPTQQDIEQFVVITQASEEDARHFLESGATLEGAIEDYFAAQTAAAPAPSAIEADDPAFDSDTEEANMAAPDSTQNQPNTGTGASAGGPRTLSGQPAEALPAGWGQPERNRFGRIQHNDGGREDDSDDDDDKKPEEMYAGGGRDGLGSGLAVQNPDEPTGNSLVDKILRMAKQNGPTASPAAGSSRGHGSAFRGTGNVLGSDEVPSSESAPAASSAPTPATGGSSGRPAIPTVAGVTPSMMDSLLAGMFGGAGRGGASGGPQAGTGNDDDDDEDDDDVNTVTTRRLTFWRNGFSIEDGPLMSYDDPANQQLLKEIESGRASPAVFGVKFNQRLNVEVAQRRSENYTPPPKQPAKPFGGSGNRLGSPAPEIGSGSGSGSGSVPGAMPPSILVGGSGSSSGGSNANAGASTSGQTDFEVDESKPTTNVQLRLGDGTRLVARVNLTHTVSDLRNYVSASRPDGRSFLLQTTFPSRELSDFDETIEGAKLQNAVVVQRFT